MSMPTLAGGVEDGGAGRHTDCPPIDRQLDHVESLRVTGNSCRAPASRATTKERAAGTGRRLASQ